MNKKKLIIIIAGISFFLIATITISLIITNNNKICKIAFYDLPENVQSAIAEEINSAFPENKNIEFFNLDKKKSNENQEISFIDNNIKNITEKIAKKYNIIFTLNGKNIENIENSLLEFPNEIYNLMPSNIAESGKINDRNVAMPILLDHFEIAYYRTFREQCDLGIPQINEHLQFYMEEIKKKAI